MAEKKVKLQAYASLDDPNAGHVEKGQTFETSEQLGKFYVKANWAGPAGTDPRDIQMAVAAENFEDLDKSRRLSSDARQVFRNLTLATAQKGNTAAPDVMPRQTLLPKGQRARTNSQEPLVEGGDASLLPQNLAESSEGSEGSEGGTQDYRDQGVPALKSEINRRREAGRDLQSPSGLNKPQLVEQLEKDDAAREQEERQGSQEEA